MSRSFFSIEKSIDRLSRDVVRLLREQNKVLTTAESCTGGMLSAAVTDHAGSAEVFLYGFCTYSDEAKIKLLGVGKNVLEMYDAVSEQVALEMARGAFAVSGADIAVSVTGLAGPGGATEEKPLGLVWFGCVTKNGEQAFFREFNAEGGRDYVRMKATEFALAVVYDELVDIS